MHYNLVRVRGKNSFSGSDTHNPFCLISISYVANFNVEDTVVFQGLKVFNSDNSCMFSCSRNVQITFVEKACRWKLFQGYCFESSIAILRRTWNSMKNWRFHWTQFSKSTVITRNLWNRKTTLQQYLSVFCVVSRQIVLLDTY